MKKTILFMVLIFASQSFPNPPRPGRRYSVAVSRNVAQEAHAQLSEPVARITLHHSRSTQAFDQQTLQHGLPRLVLTPTSPEPSGCINTFGVIQPQNEVERAVDIKTVTALGLCPNAHQKPDGESENVYDSRQIVADIRERFLSAQHMLIQLPEQFKLEPDIRNISQILVALRSQLQDNPVRLMEQGLLFSHIRELRILVSSVSHRLSHNMSTSDAIHKLRTVLSDIDQILTGILIVYAPR